MGLKKSPKLKDSAWSELYAFLSLGATVGGVVLGEQELAALGTGHRIPEAIIRLPDREPLYSVEVKRIRELRGDYVPERRRGEKRSEWSLSPIVRAGARKMTAALGAILAQSAGVRVHRHLLVIVIPNSMSESDARRVSEHVQTVMAEKNLGLEYKTEVSIARAPDAHF